MYRCSFIASRYRGRWPCTLAPRYQERARGVLLPQHLLRSCYYARSRDAGGLLRACVVNSSAPARAICLRMATSTH